MADTRIQIQVEDWIRRNWMPKKFGQKFYRERLQLSSGGVFDFDAVSADNKIAATISTSSARTASGKQGIGKLLKIRSDMYFLLLAKTQRRLVILTEQDMYDRCMVELQNGRVPSSIEFIHAQIPQELDDKLISARRRASNEVSPN